MATFLDPHYKKIFFKKQETGVKIDQLLKEHDNAAGNTDDHQDQPPPLEDPMEQQDDPLQSKFEEFLEVK